MSLVSAILEANSSVTERRALIYTNILLLIASSTLFIRGRQKISVSSDMSTTWTEY
jgi:hypothetical protein